jgi:hypothetical protein
MSLQTSSDSNRDRQFIACDPWSGFSLVMMQNTRVLAAAYEQFATMHLADLRGIVSRPTCGLDADDLSPISSSG